MPQWARNLAFFGAAMRATGRAFVVQEDAYRVPALGTAPTVRSHIPRTTTGVLHAQPWAVALYGGNSVYDGQWVILSAADSIRLLRVVQVLAFAQVLVDRLGDASPAAQLPRNASGGSDLMELIVGAVRAKEYDNQTITALPPVASSLDSYFDRSCLSALHSCMHAPKRARTDQ